MHENAHSGKAEKRGDTLTLRSLRIFSPRLGIVGECDTVDFHADPSGVPLNGRKGLWLPYPVEYKRGKPKEHNADELQLCAQALCLEEMLCCSISEGALFYGETRRRQIVSFTSELRSKLEEITLQMHEVFARGYTPRPRQSKSCKACSLSDLCLPKLAKSRCAADYIFAAIKEAEKCESC